MSVDTITDEVNSMTIADDQPSAPAPSPVVDLANIPIPTLTREDTSSVYQHDYAPPNNANNLSYKYTNTSYMPRQTAGWHNGSICCPFCNNLMLPPRVSVQQNPPPPIMSPIRSAPPKPVRISACRNFNRVEACPDGDECSYTHVQLRCAFFDTDDAKNTCNLGESCMYLHTSDASIQTPAAFNGRSDFKPHQCPNVGCKNVCLGMQCKDCNNTRRGRATGARGGTARVYIDPFSH